jgi:hypothetical protein
MWTIIKKNVDLKGKRKNNSKVYISMYLKTRIYAFLGKTFFSPVARGVDGLDFSIKLEFFLKKKYNKIIELKNQTTSFLQIRFGFLW